MLLGLLAAAVAAPPDFDAILNSPSLHGALAGAVVMRLDGSVVFARNEGLRLMPASNQKLATCAYALERLGPGHRFAARFWREPDRVVVDAENPSLTAEQLREAARILRVEPGMPVYARQAFELGPLPSWQVDDLPFAYSPRIMAFTVNRGRFDLWASGGRIEPVAPELGVRVKATGAAGPPAVEFDPHLRIMLVRGALPQERARLGGFAIPDPPRAAAAFLGGVLRRAETLPSRAPDHVIVSAPLSELVAACLQPSDNHLAEHLLLHTALAAGPGPGALMDRARAGLSAFLAEDAGCDPADLRPFDGSGLSRHNLLTARAIARLLIWARTRPWGAAFEEGLARPGVGTLRARLQGTDFRGKTGTLDLVTGLSGYVTTGAGETLVVSVLLNHSLAGAAEMRRLADAFVREAARTPPSGTNLAALSTYDRRAAANRPHPGVGGAHADRLRRSDRDRRAAPAGAHR
jgi:D-alanyl-D-alanine carboxypeptidase/D-alanyl-D-alanine-endopeptidase (penicillin-binding protein 4)